MIKPAHTHRNFAICYSLTHALECPNKNTVRTATQIPKNYIPSVCVFKKARRRILWSVPAVVLVHSSALESHSESEPATTQGSGGECQLRNAVTH